MTTAKSTRFVLSKWNRVAFAITVGVALLLATIRLFAQAGPSQLSVMKTGLGLGRVTSTSTTGIDCGTDCDEGYATSVTVTLHAEPDATDPMAVSTFVGWSGFCTGTADCPVPMTEARVVRAEFAPPGGTIPLMTDLTPEGTDGTGGIRGFLNTNPRIDSAARFIASLEPAFKQNWILMSRSESLQTGIARSPRILLPSADLRAVFTIGMTEHSAYPGAHHDAIEYMQWDPIQKNFRFHEIVLKPIPAMDVITLADGVTTRATYPARPRGVSVDDAKCPKCHSTRNIPSLDRTRIPAVPGTNIGTDGIPPGTVKAKNKPNWDAYDSWGGMLPFNRDRIYQGTLEAASFRHIFNLWNWRGSDENDRIRQILEQLSLQPFVAGSPHNITRVMDSTADDQHIVFGFDALGSPISTTSSLINYSFDRTPEAATTVPQGGRYVTLRTLTPIPAPGTLNDTYMNPGADEGRAVQFFDLLGGLDGSLNAQRISDEIINHSFATGNVPIDVRPLALAISNQCLQIDNTTSPVTIRARSGATTPPPSAAVLAFFNARNGGMNIDQVRTDTMQRWVAAGASPEVLATRSTNLPRRKVDIQKFNFDRTNDPYLVTGSPENGLIQQYGGSTNTNTSVTRLREEVFRRPRDLPSPDNTVIGGKYVDREAYDYNTDRVALFRYFLEPLGVSVDKWSMGVRGRSRTYTFADVFSTYTTPIFEPDLIASLGTRRPPGFEDPAIPFDPENCSNLLTAVNNSISTLPTAVGADAIPKYTDVQRIFNKSCIECHGGLLYPPFRNYAPLQFPDAQLDLSENENPVLPADRLTHSHDLVAAPPFIAMPPDPRTSRLYRRICPGAAGLPDINSPCPVQADGPFDERCPDGLMPCGGPRLSHTDIATIRRWIVGGASNSRGDTHIKTLDDVWYDFQSAGEFTLLRDHDLEIQTRQVPVQTDRPLDPNEHTGLVSCASLNSAVAVRAGRHRITYQPDLSGRPNPEGLELRVDGQLARMTPQGIVLESGGRIIQTPAAGGIQIETPAGTVVIITPGFWEAYQVWYLDVETHYARATEGVMAPLAPGSWLPALPDGSSLGTLPTDMGQRYADLYDKFENAWRVKDGNGLFDYAPGTSTATFTIDSWPAENPKACLVPTGPEGPTLKAPAKALTLEVAKQHCGPLAAEDARSNCTQDVMVTGDPTFAQTYLRAERVAHNKLPAAAELVAPADANRELVAPVSFTWNTTADADGDPVTYRHCLWSVGTTYNFNKCELMPTATSRWNGIWPYLLLLLLIICLLLALLIFMRNRRPALLGFAVILILAAVILGVYISKTRTSSGTLAKTVSGLESGKAYYWKVVTEDGKGGTVESETRRFQIK